MRRTYNTTSQFKLKTAMLMWFLCDYSDKHVLVSETITIPRRTADQAARQTDERNKGVLFKHCATFTDCINEKTSGCLWQYYRDELNDTLIDSEPCKSQVKVT